MPDEIPRPKFEPARWLSWDEVQSSQDEAVTQSLRRRGAYVIGRFEDPPGERPTGWEGGSPGWGVIYIGETHGRTASLAKRLIQFGHSAGLQSPVRYGHFAALRLAERCGVPEPSEYNGLEDVEKRKIYIALCPNPSHIAENYETPDARGVLPSLLEAQLLWRFVRERGVVPLLNNSGSHGGAGRAAQADAVSDGLDPQLIAAALGTDAGAVGRVEACERLGKALLNAWGYRPERWYRGSVGEDHEFAMRHVSGGYWLYVGYRGHAVFFSMWKDETCMFGATDGDASPEGHPRNEGVTTAPAVRQLVRRLHLWWHS